MLVGSKSRHNREDLVKNHKLLKGMISLLLDSLQMSACMTWHSIMLLKLDRQILAQVEEDPAKSTND